MWSPKIFYGLTYPDAYTFWQVMFHEAHEQQMLKEMEEKMWQQQHTPPVYPDWEGRRNAAGMPVGRGAPVTVTTGSVPLGEQHSVNWQSPHTRISFEHLSTRERAMATYCVRALTAKGDVSYDRAITLISDCIASGMTLENFYDMCRRGADPTLSAQMLEEFAKEVQNQQEEQQQEELRQIFWK